MATFTQKYTIIQLLEDMPEGSQFSASSWPLHTTIVDTFAVDWDETKLINELSKLLSSHESASTVALDDAFFGPHKHTRVVRLDKTDGLAKLHTDLINLLHRGGLKLNTPEYAGDGFLPHATVQKHARLNKGDAVMVNALTLIDMFPGADPDQRRVIKTIKIGI